MFVCLFVHAFPLYHCRCNVGSPRPCHCAVKLQTIPHLLRLAVLYIDSISFWYSRIASRVGWSSEVELCDLWPDTDCCHFSTVVMSDDREEVDTEEEVREVGGDFGFGIL